MLVLQHQPNFHELLEAYISDPAMSAVNLNDFREACVKCTPDIPTDILNTPFGHMFLMLEFMKMLHRLNKSVGDDQLQKEFEAAMDNVPGPRFTCRMLSETSCEDPCDWQSAFEFQKIYLSVNI